MHFEQIAQDNWEAAIALKPKRSQYKFLRPEIVLHSLARCYVQSDQPDKFVPYLIVHEHQFIGAFLFRSYGIGCNLTSFFIDQRYQGKGFGKLAMETYIDWVQQENPEFREIELAVAEENTAARNLYENLGFLYTGEKSKLGNLFMELHFNEG